MRLSLRIALFFLLMLLSCMEISKAALTHTEEDSVSSYNEDLALQIMKQGNDREAAVLFKELYNAALQAHDTLNMAPYSAFIADCLLRAGSNDIDEILHYYRTASSLYHAMDKTILELEILYDIRPILYNLNRMEEYSEITQEINNLIVSIPPSKELYALLGTEHYKEGKHDAAVSYLEKAKTLYEEAGYGTIKNVDYHTICIQLTASYYFLKRYEDAKQLAIALIDSENLQENEDDIEYTSYFVLANCYINTEKTEEALDFVEKTKLKLKNHSSAIARSLPYQFATIIYYHIGRYDQMLENAIASDSILSMEFDELHTQRLEALSFQINALSYLDRYQDAVALKKHQIQIKQPIYQTNPSEYKRDLRQLANFEAFSGYYQYAQDMDSAKIHIAEYAHIEEADIRNQAPWLTSMQRDALWLKTQQALLDITGFAIQAGAVSEPFVEEAYNAHLLAKGLYLQTEQATTEMILHHGSDEDKDFLKQLLNLRDSFEIAKREQDIAKQAELHVQIQSIENLLLKNNARLSAYEAYLNADFKTIHAAIKPGEVLVDFLEMPHSQNKDKSVTAFIIRPEWEYPHLMRVCRYSEIDSIAESIDAHLYNDSNSCAFRQLVVDSLLRYVNPGEQLFYVPDGILHNVALENLKMDDGRLMSDVYRMRRLSSAREIGKIHNQQNEKFEKAILYGALNYGNYDVTNNSNPSSSREDRDEASDDTEQRGVGDAFRPLRATSYEIETINTILRKRHIDATCYRDKEGTEESFVTLDRNCPDIIHLATHGYYLSPDQALKVKGLHGYEDAMVLSGLIMSGGNAGWLNVETENGAMDGLLTAQDIAKLDLSNAKLIVLSACKTASGQTKTDGIFGLQRAFKKAGAGSLLMSLWEVNDRTTALFMTTFYQELVDNKWDRFKAFENAKKQFKTKYPEPYYWAGFVLLD